MIYIIIGVFSIIFLAIKYLWGFISTKKSRGNDGYKEQWYGKETPEEKNEDTSIRPFKIDVPEEILEDLNLRLERARFEEPVKDSQFLYGFNPEYLKKVAEYWKTQYNWREEEKKLNKYPHFKTCIEGIDVHFMHVKPVLPEGSEIKVIPILIIHGWPGSFAEFMKAIPFLTTPRPNCSFVFEVVCPSIPGFGFSESPHRKGFTARAAARVFLTMMERIGHSTFYVQGGDWGSIIASIMARYYSPRILGLHVNMYFFIPQGWHKLKLLLFPFFPFLMSKAEYKSFYPLKGKLAGLLEETGYFHIQSTKPDTLGCGMSDSPVGMAAYLLEKFSVATNKDYIKLPDGGLTKKFSLDELLTNVMIYWVNNNFTAAARFYKESVPDNFKNKHEKRPVTVPSGVAHFPEEPLMLPRILMTDQMKNIVSHSSLPRGGHFAAMEEPQIFADDVWKFVGIVEKKN